jgi:hypothetical protein
MDETLDQAQPEVREVSESWQSRIVGHGYEAPDQLLASPDNWRIHTKGQQNAMAEILDKVGWVQSVVVNQETGHVVDGHLRVGLALSRGEASIPVVYVSLSSDEERLVLATMDPIGSMAATDSAQLMSLMSDLDVGSELSGLLNKLAGSEKGGGADVTDGQVERENEKMLDSFGGPSPNEEIVEVTCPGCGHEFGVRV